MTKSPNPHTEPNTESISGDSGEKQKNIHTEGGTYVEGNVIARKFIGGDYIEGDTTTSAEKRAIAAREQILAEIRQNAMHLALTIKNVEENNAPEPFWDIRRANETELAYQDRASHAFEQYLAHIHKVVNLREFSVAVYDSFKLNLSHNQQWATYIKNTYDHLKTTLDAFQRLEDGFQHILSLGLTDQERTLRSVSVYKEMLINAKIGMLSALAEVSLVGNPHDIAIWIDLIQTANIHLSLEPGKTVASEAWRAMKPYYAEKSAILKERSDSFSKPANRKVERLVTDPYLVLLRQTTGLPTELTEADVHALERKDIDLTEDDPQKLFRLAALSFIESDGHASILYFRRALEKQNLSPILKKYAELSLHRIEKPEIYRDSIGLMIFRVTEKGNFDRAGIKIGDVLVSINGNAIIEPMDIAYELAGDDQIMIGFIRDEKYSQLAVQGAESAGVALSPLIISKPLQL